MMEDICEGLGPHVNKGWQQSMEGMVCREMRHIQYDFYHSQGIQLSSTRWAKGLILKLLETTHGQWIHRNVQIHDNVAGTEATLSTEAIMKEIEEQMKLGDAGLLEEDHWMLEVNLGNLEKMGNRQNTGYLAFKPGGWHHVH